MCQLFFHIGDNLILEEEKKLVIKILFPEWEFEQFDGELNIRRSDYFPGLCLEAIPLEHWHPNKQRKYWDEIWEKMEQDSETKRVYLYNVGEEAGPFRYNRDDLMIWKSEDLVDNISQVPPYYYFNHEKQVLVDYVDAVKHGPVFDQDCSRIYFYVKGST